MSDAATIRTLTRRRRAGIGTAAARGRAALLRALAGGGGLLPCVPLWVWWAAWEGGYPPSVWLVGPPFLATIAVALAVRAPRPRLRGAPAWALAALVALTVWTWASLLWAGSPESALLGAERRSLLLAAFALPLLWPPSPAALRACVAALCGAALLSAGVGLAAARLDTAALLDGRLTDPTGYPNAQAALPAMAALAALVLAAHLPTRLERSLGWSAGGALAALAVLSQSRGAVAATALALLVLVALVSFRFGLLLSAAAVAAGVGLALGPLLAVRPAALAGDAGATLTSALAAVAILAVALALAGWAVGGRGFGGRRLRPHPPAGTAGRAHGPVLKVVAGCAAIVVVGLAAAPGTRGWIGDRIEDFDTPRYGRLASADSRFVGGLGSFRYRYWRASLDVFAGAPVAGEGAGSFAAEYLRRRASGPSPRYAHGLAFGTLAELGAVGLALLLSFAAAIAVAIAVACRRAPPRERVTRIAAVAPLLYLAIHGSGDWVGAFPALAVPAVGLAGGAASAVAPGGRELSQGERGGRGRSWLVAATVVAIGLVAIPMLASERLAARGMSGWRDDPAAALSDLRAAEALNPLSARAALAEGVVCLELHRSSCAEDAFREAAARDPSGWFERLELGLLAARRGDDDDARRLVLAARRLNPLEPTVARALGAGGAVRALDPLAVATRALGGGTDARP